MEGGSSSSNGTSYLLAFGENNSGGLCPMTMMPLVTSHHAGHHPINPSNNNNVNTNCLFIPNCSNSTGTPSIMLHNNHNNNKTDDDDNNNNTGLGYYFMESDHHHHHHGNNNNNGSSSSSSSSAVKAKIMAHPHYHRLLAAYVNCQKVGAPPEVVARLEEACASAATMAGGDAAAGSSCIGEDPALDQFMEAYCEMLTKYEQELSKPLKEAMLFLQRIECQFKNLTISSSDFGDDPLPLSIFYLLKYSAYLKSLAGFASFILLKVLLEMNTEMDECAECSLLVNLGLVNNLGIRVSSAVVVPRSGKARYSHWKCNMQTKKWQKRVEVLWG
ncbi:Homeobox protein SBH1 [Glycine soja]|nr:Homeobox protein SBH1 [Glycine soja]